MKGDRRMINLQSITEENWLKVTELTVNEEQKRFLAPPIGILARAYVYRNCNGKVYVIADDNLIVGVSLVREFTDEPLGYELQQFMIDKKYQGKGYGKKALELILDELRKEHHYDHVEVCVNKEDNIAIHVYEKAGFVDSGYIDDDLPDYLNLICYFDK